MCGTDLHIHEGEFLAKFPLIPGHETVGVVAGMGSNVKGFTIGERVVADNSELCGECFYCRRGELLLCEHFEAHGVTMDGGFAEYCAYPAGRVFKIHNLTDVDATLLEPASCAAHGLDKIAPKMGSSVLMFGAGPTGLVLTQMLRQNGGCHVVVAAPEGLKMRLAKSLDAADEYVELSRKDPSPQFQKIKDENPYGFDIVVEATGSVKVLEDAINYVRRGGKLVVYGVYSNKDRVTWPPSKICKLCPVCACCLPETCSFPISHFCLTVSHSLCVHSRRRNHHPRLLQRNLQVPRGHRLPRQGQGQGPRYCQQDLHDRPVGRVYREHEEQVGHQSCDYI